jgi:hypothetical protein
MGKIRGLEKEVALKIIARESESIKVYSSEVDIWLAIYRIVFAVEFERAKRRLSEEEVSYEAEARLVDYLNHNPNEKKYRFIKISNRTFRSLKIKKCTGDYWLAAIFKKFAAVLSPEVDQAALLRKPNRGVRTPICSQPYPPLPSPPFVYLAPLPTPLPFQYKPDLPSPELYTIQFKARMAEIIDGEVEKAIGEIISQKQNEYKINGELLKHWHVSFGRLGFFTQNFGVAPGWEGVEGARSSTTGSAD